MSEKNWGRILDIETLDASSLAPRIAKRNVFGPHNGWDDYVLRHFILPEGDAIPMHEHEWDHLIISLSGHGKVNVDGEDWDLDAGNWTRVPGGTLHQYSNIGKGDWTFLCIVPTHGDPHAKKFSMREERRKRKEAEQEA